LLLAVVSIVVSSHWSVDSVRPSDLG